MEILLTGASGFVGSAILKIAKQRQIRIRPVFRSKNSVKGHPEALVVSGLNADTDWSHALNDVDVVIHAAARAHVMRELGPDSLNEYRLVNVEGTLNLARQAAMAGVRRFVFISSIKVNGETTRSGCPFTANDAAAPEDEYGQSKAEAEVKLRQIANDTGMEITIIRPPLIYGLGVKGNFASLIKWTRRGLPLPLGAVTRNSRSLVGVDNLVDLILLCTSHPNAANQIFLVSDGEDMSTADLLRKIANASGRPSRLLWVPQCLISLITSLMGKEVVAQRLLGSLQLDIRKTCELLDWNPSVSVDEGLRRALE